jgi:hypothetical protein
MDMRRVGLFVLAIVAVTCGPSPDAKLPGYENLHANGGTTDVGSGGNAGGGGTTQVGSGGTTVNGTGGRLPGSGGRGTGGSAPVGTGGQGPGTGGRTTLDAGVDRVNRDGAGTGGRGTGGTTPDGTGGQGPGTGGRTGGTGGITGRDGGAGGVQGTGGTTSTIARDAAPRDTAGSCYATLASNGYACGSAAPCSACKVNNESKEAECQKGIDCLAAAGASCDSNCQLTCLNSAGDAQVGACIKALTTVACGASGC